MKITVKDAIIRGVDLQGKTDIELNSLFFNSYDSRLEVSNCFAYPPLINSHDHLIGNWFPRAGDSDLYPNAHIWVNDMKESTSVKERDKIWLNSLPMNFYQGNGKLLALLGSYKNIFSGINAVQDHSPKQQKEYYDMFPINVLQDFQQCHSLPLGNFWGGEDPKKEYELSGGTKPFILHLGEGLDPVTAKEFQTLKQLDLLQSNTLIIHGIALTEKDIKECAVAGTSICWCPFSNHFLIGKTLDIQSCLKYRVNVVIGTDSTLSGSVNMFAEIKFAAEMFPSIPSEQLFKMITVNARKALFLPETYGTLKEKANDSLLLIEAKKENIYDNLVESNPDNIVLLIHEGIPLFGRKHILEYFQINTADYYFYKKEHNDYFVFGHPEKIMSTINGILGYDKKLPYLPFLTTETS